MDTYVYNIILGIAGLFFGQIAGRLLIYRVIHPYIVVPYIKRKREKNMTLINHNKRQIK